MRRHQAQGRKPHNARPAPSPRRPRRGISTDPSPLRHSDEKEPDLGKPQGQKRRRRSHEDDGAGHARPHPIYTPDAQIRGSPALPPPERTEKGRGTRGGAGETGEKTESPFQSPLSTVAEGREKGEEEPRHPLGRVSFVGSGACRGTAAHLASPHAPLRGEIRGRRRLDKSDLLVSGDLGAYGTGARRGRD
jgi:hypothetical protein